jgi:uncharacterized protein with PhoU and TrkA domain
VSIFVLYRLIVASRIGNRLLSWLRRPLMKRILREAPPVEEIFHVGKNWGVSLVAVSETSRSIGLSVGDLVSDRDVRVLAVDRADDFIPTPDNDERIEAGDRLLVYGLAESVRNLAR